MGQLILQDVSASGRVRPWAENKMSNEILATAYESIDLDKAERLRGCASFLQYRKDASGVMRLYRANFCRVRLCPICTWRRSLKLTAQATQVIDYARKVKPQAYAMLTLTVPSCTADDLSSLISKMSLGWHKLSNYKAFGQAVRGYLRSMEVTHNTDNDTYHPHYHVLLQVAPSYFKSRYYLSRDTWLDMWRRAMQDESITQVDVRRVKGDTIHAIAEVAKYACKPADYIIPNDWDMTVDTVSVLDQALNKRRFVGWGGDLKLYHQRLSLDDVDDGDLLQSDGHDVIDDRDMVEIVYWWYPGYRQYRAG